MPVSRGRRRKKAQQESPPSQSYGKTTQKTFWERVQNHPIPWMLGLASALIAIATPIWQALYEPDISVGNGFDVSSPFSLPFMVHNSSAVFSMRGARLKCRIEKAVFEGERVINRGVMIGDAVTIEPGGDAGFRCLLGDTRPTFIYVPSGVGLVSAHIFLSTVYQTLWFSRASKEKEFTWYTASHPPRWISGKIAPR